jgi:hypothetical protein
VFGSMTPPTFFMMISYAEIRSEATKSRVFSLTSYKSLTFPSAILGSPSMQVDNKTVSAIVRVPSKINGEKFVVRKLNDYHSAPAGPGHCDCEIVKWPPNYGGVRTTAISLSERDQL